MWFDIADEKIGDLIFEQTIKNLAAYTHENKYIIHRINNNSENLRIKIKNLIINVLNVVLKYDSCIFDHIHSYVKRNMKMKDYKELLMDQSSNKVSHKNAKDLQEVQKCAE
ncbi:hypothetical protein EDEG_01162 [Edhazardia aedis USNM 41457]|uniref:Uncharacterized protein n=1 Tax=Edhazardia aedis (strain USNM 41457) TaxID=1003232 RepID=J9DQ10_EDHAE|nr:hypothetical protein EDEG_01162 [Edhazardia aedis USNM 41457]|eukprot:EJW04635.1 hypothetical protein EDEG_01162 [Edhazardia aedis USNM 41457]